MNTWRQFNNPKDIASEYRYNFFYVTGENKCIVKYPPTLKRPDYTFIPDGNYVLTVHSNYKLLTRGENDV
jgi:hypothetical protein